MSRAWFAVAVAAVLGLFYVGYRLQNGSSGTPLAQVPKSKGYGGPPPAELAPVRRPGLCP